MLTKVMLELTIRLAGLAYDGPDAFAQVPGSLLHYTTECYIHQPLIYVFQHETGLFVVTKGSSEAPDFRTDMEFSQVINEFGVFHGGFVNAALWVWDQVKDFVVNYDGPVHFCGHSYGASVSAVLHVIAKASCPDKDFYSYSYAQMPCMELETAELTKETMYTFVNEDDIIPTLSVPNCFERIKLLSPLISIIPSSWITAQLRGVIKLVKVVGAIEEEFMNMIYDSIPEIVEDAKAYEKGIEKYVRFVAGNIYHIDSDESLKVAETLIDPTETLSCLSLTTDCISRHACDLYTKAINNLNWE